MAAGGLASEVMFLGGLFEHFNAEPQFEQFHEYKNAANTYTQTGFTDAHREAAESYLGSIYDTAVAAMVPPQKQILTTAKRSQSRMNLSP